MPSHTGPKFQYVARSYRVVTVRKDGTRKTLSEHKSFLAADRATRMIPSEDGAEIRIETAVDTLAVRLAG